MELNQTLSKVTTSPDSAGREKARFNMIEQQIRTWEVLDPAVLELFHKIPREDFVPAQYLGLAFADLEIPIGHGQTMLSPKVEGRILQALEIRKTDKVLEIGTGSGYLTALLATLADKVYSIELNADLSSQAKTRLAAHGLNNVILETGDAAQGWPSHAPYDVIVYTGSLPMLPKLVQQDLSIGGRMFVVVGEPPVMEAIMIQRTAQDGFRQQVLFETCLPILANVPQPTRFEF